MAKELYNTQIKFKFPGLVQECMKLIEDLGLPNITIPHKIKQVTKNKWKQLVKKAIKDKCETELKNEILKFKKLKDGPMKEENFKTQQYLKDYQLEKARPSLNIGVKC